MTEVTIKATRDLVDKTLGGKPTPVMLGAYLAEQVDVSLTGVEVAAPELLAIIGLDEPDTPDRAKAKAVMMIISVYQAVQLMDKSVEHHLNNPDEDEEEVQPLS